MNADTEISLTARTVRGAGWIVGWRIATRLLGTVSTLLLVRLLVPADFGVVALGSTFANAMDGLTEIGVGNALIREHRLDRTMYDTGFTLGCIRGILTASVIAACAQPVAAFFGEPRLAHILLALAAGMLIGSVENIGVIDFQRNLTFGREFGLLLAPRLLGIVACLTVAYVWRTYWALVVGILVSRCMRTVCSYVMHSYRPRFSLGAWRTIVGFSFWSWMLAWVTLIRDRIDTFVVGRLLGATQVGLYTIACDVGLVPSTELLQPICRALYPGLARVRNRDTGDIAGAYFRAVSATLMLTLPAGIGIALVADPLMRLAIGPRWVAAIPLVQILAVVGVFRVVTYVSTTLLTVYGMLKVQFANTSMILLIWFALLIALIARFGLVGAGYALGIVAVLEEVVYLVLTFRRFRLRPRDLFASNWRPVLATAAMAGVVLLMQASFVRSGAGPTFGHLFAEIVAGAACYVTVVCAAWLAAGRPAGAEDQAITLLRQATGAIQRRWPAAR